MTLEHMHTLYMCISMIFIASCILATLFSASSSMHMANGYGLQLRVCMAACVVYALLPLNFEVFAGELT